MSVLTTKTQDFQDAISSLEHCRQPVICAMYGYALGLAIDIASACDVRFAASNVTMGIMVSVAAGRRPTPIDTLSPAGSAGGCPPCFSMSWLQWPRRNRAMHAGDGEGHMHGACGAQEHHSGPPFPLPFLRHCGTARLLTSPSRRSRSASPPTLARSSVSPRWSATGRLRVSSRSPAASLAPLRPRSWALSPRSSTAAARRSLVSSFAPGCSFVKG